MLNPTLSRLPSGPLIEEAGMSDPHALVRADGCYLFTGHDVGFGVEDWVMPDWRIYHSTDLYEWRQVGGIDPKDNYMGEGSVNCWAGDIVEHKGKFYWFFSNRSWSTGVMVADSVEGPYRDVLGGPLVESFDPTVFVDADGAAYLIVGHGEYQMARLDDSMTALAEPLRPIELDRKGIFPVMDKNSLHKHNGIYYLGCSGYYAVSKHLYGPYVYHGLVGERLGLATPYAHGDFFEYRGQWFHVWCHYRDRSLDRIRDCYLAPVLYGEDGSMRDDLTGLA